MIQPPLAVRNLMTRGCEGIFAITGAQFDRDETVAMVRYFTRVLQSGDAGAGDQVVEVQSRIAAASLDRHRQAQPLACARGCASCCHQKVSVGALEAFAIARVLRRGRDLAAHRARLAARPDWSDGDPARPYDIGRPCAFLVGGACSIHSFRPLICRIVVSFDVRACLRQLADGHGAVQAPRHHAEIRTWITTAMIAAQQAAGLRPRTYELAGVVAALLAEPGLEARWYAGDEAGLAAVADPPFPDRIPEVEAVRALARI